MEWQRARPKSFAQASISQEQEWNRSNIKSLDTAMLQKHYNKCTIADIIQNYSFKDPISQKIFSTTVTKSNENQSQECFHATSSPIEEVVTDYTDLLQSLTSSPKTTLDVSKHFPNIMDKRCFQIQQIMWNTVAKANRSVLRSPLRALKDASYADRIRPFFYLKSFLSPTVIEHLPVSTFLDVISEVKCLQFPSLSSTNIRDCNIQFTEFTWELVHWLLLVMKHFEGKNEEILRDCSQGLNHLCSQTSDALSHYLLIQEQLKSDQISDRSREGMERLNVISQQIQGPRQMFPYCLLNNNYFSDSYTTFPFSQHSVHRMSWSQDLECIFFCTQFGKEISRFDLQTNEKPKFVLEMPEHCFSSFTCVQDKIVVCTQPPDSNGLSFYITTPNNEKPQWKLVEYKGLREILPEGYLFKGFFAVGSEIYLLVHVTFNDPKSGEKLRSTCCCIIGTLLESPELHIQYLRRTAEFEISALDVESMNCISDGRFLLLTTMNIQLLIQNINSVKPVARNVHCDECNRACLDIKNERLYMLAIHGSSIDSVRVSLYKEHQYPSPTLPHNLWKDYETLALDTPIHVAQQALIHLDKISEFSLWAHYQTIHCEPCIEHILYDILSFMAKPLTELKPSTFELALLLACLRLVRANLIHYVQISRDKSEDPKIKAPYPLLLHRIIKFTQQALRNTPNDVILQEILSNSFSICVLPLWFTSEKDYKKIFQLLVTVGKTNIPCVWKLVLETIQMDLLSLQSPEQFQCHFFVNSEEDLMQLWHTHCNTLANEFFVEILFLLFSGYITLSHSSDKIVLFSLNIIKEVLVQIEEGLVGVDGVVVRKLLPCVMSQLWNAVDSFKHQEIVHLLRLLHVIHKMQTTEAINTTGDETTIFRVESMIIETGHPYLLECHDDDIEKFYPLVFPGADFVIIRFSPESVIGPNDEIHFYNNSVQRFHVPFCHEGKTKERFDLNQHKTISFSSNTLVMFFYGTDENFHGFRAEVNAYYSSSDVPKGFSFIKDLERSISTICGRVISEVIHHPENNPVKLPQGVPASWLHEKDGLLRSGLQNPDKIIYSENIPFLVQVVQQSTDVTVKLVHVMKNLSSSAVLGGYDDQPELLEMELMVFAAMLHQCGLSAIAEHCGEMLLTQAIEQVEESELSSLVFLWNQCSYIREWAFKQHHDVGTSYELLRDHVRERTMFLNHSLVPVNPPLPIKRTRTKKRRSSLRRSSTVIVTDSSSQEALKRTSSTAGALDTHDTFLSFVEKLRSLQNRQTVASSPAAQYIHICSAVVAWAQSASPSAKVIATFLANKTSRCEIRTIGYTYLLELLQIPAAQKNIGYCTSKLTVPRNPLLNLKCANVFAREKLIQHYYELIDYLLPGRPEDLIELQTDTLYLCRLNINSLRDFHLIKEKRLLHRISDIIFTLCGTDDESVNLKYLVYLFAITVAQCIQYTAKSHLSSKDDIAGTVFAEIIDIISSLLTTKSKWIKTEMISLIHGIRPYISHFPLGAESSQDHFILVILQLLPITQAKEQVQLLQVLYYQLQSISTEHFGFILGTRVDHPTEEWLEGIIQIIGVFIRDYHFASIQEPTFTHNRNQAIKNVSLGKRKSKKSVHEPLQKKQRLEENVKHPLLVDVLQSSNFHDGECRSVIRELIWMLQRLTSKSDWTELMRRLFHRIWKVSNEPASQILLMGLFGILGGLSDEILLGDHVVASFVDNGIRLNCHVKAFVKDYILVAPDSKQLPLLVPNRLIEVLDAPVQSLPTDKHVCESIIPFILRQRAQDTLTLNFALRVLNSISNLHEVVVSPGIIPFLRKLILSRSVVHNDDQSKLNRKLSLLRQQLALSKIELHRTPSKLSRDDVLELLKKELPYAIHPIVPMVSTGPENPFELMLPCYLIVKQSEITRTLVGKSLRSSAPVRANYMIPRRPWLDCYYFEITISKCESCRINVGFSFVNHEARTNSTIMLSNDGRLALSFTTQRHLETLQFGKGDVIGCGVYFTESDGCQFFFAKNSAEPWDDWNSVFHQLAPNDFINPIVICNGPAEVSINFGQSPFRHIESFREWKVRVLSSDAPTEQRSSSIDINESDSNESDELDDENRNEFMDLDEFSDTSDSDLDNESLSELSSLDEAADMEIIESYERELNEEREIQRELQGILFGAGEYDHSDHFSEGFSSSSSDDDDDDDEDSENFLYMEDTSVLLSFKDIHQIKSISKKYSSLTWRTTSVPKASNLPPWITMNPICLSPTEINYVTIGDAVGVNIDQNNFRTGIVLEISYSRNSVYLDFFTSKEWVPISQLLLFPSAPHQERSLTKQMEELESAIMQKLSLQTFARLSSHVTLSDVLGDGTRNGLKLFALLCQEHITIPLQNQLDHFYSAVKGIVSPVISPYFTQILKHTKSLFIEALHHKQSAANHFMNYIREYVIACSGYTNKTTNYESQILKSSINEEICRIQSPKSTEMVVNAPFSVGYQRTMVYLDKECKNKLGPIHGGIHCPVNEVYLKPAPLTPPIVFPRGNLKPTVITEDSLFDFTFLWGAFELLASVLMELDDPDLTNKFLDDVFIENLIPDLTRDNTTRLGVDGHLLQLLNIAIRLRKEDLGENIIQALRLTVVPWVQYNVMLNSREVPHLPVLSIWSNACFEFFAWRTNIFMKTTDHSFELMRLSLLSVTHAIEALEHTDDISTQSNQLFTRMIGRYFLEDQERESEHPYHQGFEEEISFPGAVCIVIAFDQRTIVNRLEIFKRKDTRAIADYDKYSFPYEFLVIHQSSFFYSIRPPKKEPSKYWGYKFSVLPIYDEMGCEKLFKDNLPQSEELLKQFTTFHKNAKNTWNKERDIQLISLLDYFISIDQRGGNYLDVFELKRRFQSLGNDILSRYPLLMDLSREELIYRSCLLSEMNDSHLLFLSYTSLQNRTPKCLPHFVRHYKHNFLFFEKKELLKFLNERNENEDEVVPSAVINRMSSMDGFSVFEQLYQQMGRTAFSRNNEQMFQVNFVGEEGIDEGGLFRDAMTQIASDIQDILFVKTPNSHNEHGSQDVFVPNPSRNSPKDVRMFEFVGRLVGSCVLACSIFSGISWPIFVWKAILEEEITDEDFRDVDSLYYESIDMLRNIPKSEMDQEFTDLISLAFTIRTLDGNEVELIPDGKNIDVNWHNRLEYVRLASQYKRNEIKRQLDALRRGFITGTDELCYLFECFTPKELQRLVQGEPKVDLNVLRLHTNYNNCTIDSPVVQFLWNILESFDDTQRRAFLKFTSGSTSLPSQWGHRQFTIFVTQKAPGEYFHLPSAHTCSWRLDIPNYSNEALFREKLLLSLASGDSFTFC